MSGRRSRDILAIALAVAWVLVAAGAAMRDWPTPERLAGVRLHLAMLLANAVDKDFRPYDTPLREDPNAQYQELVADYTARFGERFDVAFIERRHADAMAAMAAERLKILLFAGLSTAVVWWLIWTIRNLLRPGSRSM
jgi:hypothetical protein